MDYHTSSFLLNAAIGKILKEPNERAFRNTYGKPFINLYQ